MASVLELILRSRKEGDAAKKTEAELKKVTKASGGAEVAVKKLNIAMLALEGVAFTAGLAFLKSIPSIVDYGVEIGRAEIALIAYAGSSEEAARSIELMKDAADGAMSKMDAMRNATRMLSMGLAENANEAAKLTKIAVTLGSTMGKGPQAAIEDFTLMLANQSILRLDTFGISGAKVREIMADLAEKGIAPADRQARFLAATLEVAEEKMTNLEAAGYKASSSTDRLKATMEDAKAAGATWLADGLMPIIDGIFALNDAQEKYRSELIKTSTYEEYRNTILGDVPLLMEPLIKNQWILTEAEFESARASLEASDALVALGDDAGFVATRFNVGYVAMRNASSAMEGIQVAAGTAGQAIDLNLTGSIGRFLDELEWLEAGGAEILASFETVKAGVLSGALTEEEGKRFGEGLFVMAEDLQVDLGNITAYEAALNIREQLGGSFDEARGKLDGIDKALGDLPTELEILIKIRTEGEIPAYQHGGSFTVPPGFPNDSFPFLVSSGEHVQVTPAQHTTTHQDNRQLFGPGAQVNVNEPVARETVFSWINEYFGA